MQERCDVTNKNNTSPIRKVVYKQFEYVLTIIASQGKTYYLIFLFMSLMEKNCVIYLLKETQFHTNLGQH